MVLKNPKQEKRRKIRNRIRKKIQGTADRPRLSVYKSNKVFYAQIINDEEGKTLVSVDTRKLGGKKKEYCVKAGEELAKKATKKGIKNIFFDRSGYLYTSNIAAFSKAANEAGLKH